MAVTGPLMADDAHAEIASLAEAHHVDVHRVLPELRNTIAEADCVVSMAGYNTVCDIMSYGRRSILVPRARPSREQSLRAERLRACGIANVIQADDLRPESLTHAIEHALEQPAPAMGALPLGGLESALNVFDDVCDLDVADDATAVSPELVLVDPTLR